MSIQAIDPATGAELERYPETTEDEVARAAEEAHAAHLAFRRVPFAERAARMRRAAELLRERAGALAGLMADEMGKPVRDGRAEAQKCAAACDWYAEHAERLLAPETVDAPDLGKECRVVYRPLGVVLAVMPWNFPFWQVFRFVAPALMAANAGLLKHASNVPGCALAIQRVVEDAGFPRGLFRALLVPNARVDALVAHPRVAAVTLTGSSGAGRAVARRAGEALKKTVLELGGSNPYLVLEDADLEAAADTCAKSRMINGGQSCIAAKRFIVAEPVRARFEELFVARMKAFRMGAPRDEATELGPLARRDLRDALHAQVEASIRAGARLALGGAVPAGPGAFYPPTVLADVRPGMVAFDEELFGPVAAIAPARDEAHAIELANASPFGLGAAVFTRDRARGARIAEDMIDAGSCFVNALVKSDPRLPFGGIKESGYGRELAAFGIREFANVKTIVVA